MCGILLLLASLTISKPYERLTYHKVLSILETAAKNSPETISLEEATEKYSEYLNPLTCSGGPCRYPIVTITNFNSSKEDISRRPQLLLIGSFHGNEILGTHTLTYLIKHISEKRYSERFWRMLNTRRLVIYPMANPFGFSRDRRVKILYLILVRKRDRPQPRLPLQPKGLKNRHLLCYKHQQDSERAP